MNEITEAADGEVVGLSLSLDAVVPLRLSSEWAWDEPLVSGDAVELQRVDYAMDPGFMEWEVLPTGVGAAEVTATGDPNCGDPAACPRRTVMIRFEVTE